MDNIIRYSDFSRASMAINLVTTWHRLKRIKWAHRANNINVNAFPNAVTPHKMVTNLIRDTKDD